ncbi:protein of unknown function [Methylotuvimicrobium alcaliphilum 20Z]|uniref:Uncharacterized protein n=2 Tax=Methylotuvimicrobium alcaliphilum TaxID=271065 RepID=G4SVA6_META2|nr:protein of unknown function [Methylotuvimicrobium alcaliphilum 20Z]
MAVFQNAEAVNEALGYSIEVDKRTNSLTQRSSGERQFPAADIDATDKQQRFLGFKQ